MEEEQEQSQRPKSLIVPTKSCFSAHHRASGLLPPGILAPGLSPPAPFLPHPFPRDHSSPGTTAVPICCPPNRSQPPKPPSPAPAMPRHHPTLALGPPHSPPERRDPRCRPLCLSRSRALPAGGDSGWAQPSSTHAASAPLGHANPARRSEQLASIPTDYIGAGNAGERRGSERGQIRCPRTAGCCTFRDVTPRVLRYARRQAARLKELSKSILAGVMAPGTSSSSPSYTSR